MSKLLKYAEDTSHAFLGESSSGPANPDHTPLQRVLAHGLGYLSSPLRYGMELATDGLTSLFPQQRGGGSPRLAVLPQKDTVMSAKQLKKVKKAKGKGKKPFKKRIPRPKKVRMPTYSISRLRAKRPRAKNFFRKQYNSEFPAPVSIGHRRNWTNSMSFKAGRRPGCIKMHGKVLLGDIMSYTDATSNTGMMLRTSLFAKYITQYFVMPQNTVYMGTGPVNTFAYLFERYEMKTRLHFLTSAASSTPGALKLGYYEDPVSFYGFANKKGNVFNTLGNTFPAHADTPVSADLADCQNSVEGSVWRDLTTGWSTKITKDTMKYLPAFTYSTYVDPSTTESEDLRANIQGNWIITGSGIVPGGVNTTNAYGELWLEYEFELCDLLGTGLTLVVPGPDGTTLRTTTLPRPMRHTRQVSQEQRLQALEALVLAGQRPEEAKEEKDSDWTKLRTRKSESRKSEKNFKGGQ